MLPIVLLLPTLIGAVSVDRRIVGGSDQDIADFPWQGSFRLGGSHSCGCVLVAPEWAVTAAHCGGAIGKTTGWGSTGRTSEDMLVIPVESVTAHPGWEDGTTPGAFPNDIAVIRLAGQAVGDNIQAVAMGTDRLEGAGELATITGWGRTCGLCALPETLQGAELDVLSDAECAGFWGSEYNGDVHVCVNEREGQSKGACNGDSGGPMVSGGVLHGVTSWGRAGCSTEWPSSYTRITTFREWVCSETGSEAEGC